MTGLKAGKYVFIPLANNPAWKSIENYLETAIERDEYAENPDVSGWDGTDLWTIGIVAED